MSPGFTLSPSLTSHFIRFPFSIVGDNAGNPSFACFGKEVPAAAVGEAACGGGVVVC